MFVSAQHPGQFGEQNILVQIHKITLNIHFQNITIPVIIIGARTDKMVQPFYAVARPPALAATVAVVYKYPFKYVIDIVEYQMVDYAVAEPGGEYFSFNGMVVDKAYAGRELIFPV